MHGFALASVASVAVTSAATNTTLYHVNPLSYPAAPVNMDLGDVAGDLFFDISQILNVYACYDKPVAPYIICDNKETVGKDLGVTKVVLAVSEQSYGPYATCNICLNGTSPLNTSHSCTKGEYVCDCENGAFPPKKVPCTAAVGYENTSNFLGRAGIGRFCPLSRGHSKVAACAIGTAADKLQGSWFSTLKQGEGTTWRLVKVVKRVRRDCHSNSFYNSVERALPACFGGCQGGAGAGRNTSSLCWAGCFVDAALGPQARASTSDLGSGMTREDLISAWSRPFDSDDAAKGGCLHVPWSAQPPPPPPFRVPVPPVPPPPPLPPSPPAPPTSPLPPPPPPSPEPAWVAWLTRNSFGTAFGGSFLALSVCVLFGALAYLGSVVITKREAIRRRLEDRRPGLNSRSPIEGGGGMTTSMLDQASSAIYD
jgi:hypothetical protein